MLYYVMFMVEKEGMSSNNMASIYANYSWWTELIEKALNKADIFETRLWSDDKEAIEFGIKYGKTVVNKDSSELVFQGKVTNDFIAEVIEHYLTKEGSIKWFTLNLYKDNRMLFSSQHYGDETLIFDLSKEEVKCIQEWAKQYSIIQRVDVYDITN